MQRLKPAVLQVMRVQGGIAVVAALIALAVAGPEAGAAALAGGGIAVVGNAGFALRMFSAGPGSTARQVARAFYVGEVVKLALSAALLALALVWLELPFLPLLFAYAAALMAHWLVLPFSTTRSTGKTQ